MHIDVIVKYFYPVAAGIETNILETYGVLVEQGWTVTVHTSKDTLTEKNHLADTETLRGIGIKRYPYRWWSFWPRIDWQKTNLVCMHNFNVIPHAFIMVYAAFLKLIGRKHFALMLTPHGGFNPEWSIFSKPVAFVKKTYHYTLGVLLINMAVDGVRAVSEWEHREIASKRVQNDRIITISNGIEDEAYGDVEGQASEEIKRRVSGFGRYVIQIGRIYMIKNYEAVVRAFLRLPADLKFVIVGPVGDRAYETNLKRMIAELGLADRVIFMGVVRGVDKYYLIKKAEMMAHMALWESYCNVVHEGLSQGLVCIVSNVYALPYLVKDGVNGYCLNPHDDRALAEKISFVLEHKNDSAIVEMKKRNRAYGLADSWRSVASRMEDFYKNAVAGVR